MREQGIRVETDLRNEKIGYKIREHSIRRVPYLLVAGGREMDARSVAVRTQSGEDLGTQTVDEFTQRIVEAVANRELAATLKS